MRVLILVCLILLNIGFSTSVRAQQFLEKHNELGVQGFARGTYGSGISLHDWNKDGFDDIVLLSKDSLPAFYLNTGAGFQRVVFDGIDISNDLKSVVWADMNNDGSPDLSFNSFNGGLKLYLNNGDFSFTDITTSSGVIQSAIDWGFGISWIDFNNDGFLDLFVSNYNIDNSVPGPNHLYRNHGDLTFSEVTNAAGINSSNESTFMGVWFDYNNDNRSDLLVLNDRVLFQNYLYKNQGAGMFQDVSQNAGVMDFMDSMTGTIGDYNNDGFLDIYISNTPGSGNKFYHNYGDGTFIDVASDFGLRVYQWSWGATWVDYNNDAFQDLFVVTQPYAGNGSVGNHYLYRNNNGSFDWQVSAGFAASVGATFSTARGDFNNDGHPDLVTHSFAPLGVEIWMNQIQNGNYLKVALEGVISNRDAIGARITAYSDGIKQTRYTHCGEQFISQNSQWQHFGLAAMNSVDSLVIKWPSGHQDVFYNVSSNQSLHIIEGSSITNQITIAQGSAELCPGDSVILDGGNWNHYQWSTGDTTRFIWLSAADSVSLEVRNVAGFIIPAAPMIVSLFQEPNYTVLPLNPTCFGKSDGSIELVAIDSDSIAVLWDNGYSGVLNTNLPESTFYYTIPFGQGCSISDSTELIAPALLQLDSVYVAFNVSTSDTCSNSYVLHSLSSGGTLPHSYNWYLYANGNSNPYLIIENQDQLCIRPDQNVRAVCYVIDSNFCTDSMVVNLAGITSVEAITSHLLLFPNPFEDVIHIQSALGIEEIILTDISGRTLSFTSEKVNDKILDISKFDLVQGIYFVHIRSGNNWSHFKMQKK